MRVFPETRARLGGKQPDLRTGGCTREDVLSFAVNSMLKLKKIRVFLSCFHGDGGCQVN